MPATCQKTFAALAPPESITLIPAASPALAQEAQEAISRLPAIWSIQTSFGPPERVTSLFITTLELHFQTPGASVNPLISPAPSSVGWVGAREAASSYASIMSPTARPNKVSFSVLHAGPEGPTVYISPVTSSQIFPSVAVIAVPAIGLVPISPTIADGETSEIPDVDRIAKLPADPRSTGNGPAAIPGEALESSASSAAVRTKLLDALNVFDMMFFCF